MRVRHWNTIAMAIVAAMAVSACGGDQGADGSMDQDGQDAPAADTATEDQQAPEQVAVDLPEGVTQAQYEEGRQLFTGQGACHACHGPDATGTMLAPNLTDDEWLNVSGRNFDEIVELIHTGVPEPMEHPSPMMPMGGADLTDEQVEALAAYVVGIGQG